MVLAATSAAVGSRSCLGLTSPAGRRLSPRQQSALLVRPRRTALHRCVGAANSFMSVPVATSNPPNGIRPQKPSGDMGIGGQLVADGISHPPAASLHPPSALASTTIAATAATSAAAGGGSSAAPTTDSATGISTGLSSRWWPGAADVSAATAGQPMASSGGDDAVTIVVLGDLHLEPGQMSLFHEARDQIVRLLVGDPGISASDGLGSSIDGSSSGSGNRSTEIGSERGSAGERGVPRSLLVQLGDVGGYSNKPGSAECFRSAVSFLDSFRLPRVSVTGNHDLEGTEFESDERNLLAWKEAFGQEHYWRRDLGDAGVCLGLSTVRFRDSKDSCHEVFVDEEQVAWMTAQLAAVEAEGKGRPVFVFTHAPPMGCGLTSLQEVHVRNRCAWLNHSCPATSRKFLDLVRSRACIKLWFSGHFHLSHDYEGSLSRVASCLFVQTGVMGGCHRDGRRHSRVLRATKSGYHLLTLDHTAGETRTDVRHVYENEARGIPPQRLWCSTLSGMSACAAGGAFSPVMPADLAARDQDQFPPFARASVGGAVRANGGAAAAAAAAAGAVGAAGGTVGEGLSVLATAMAPAGAGAVDSAIEVEVVGLPSPAKRRNTSSSTTGSSSSSGSGTVRWLQMGETVLAVHANQILEYDLDARAPIGVVCDAVNGRSIRLVARGRVGEGNGGVNGGVGREGEEGEDGGGGSSYGNGNGNGSSNGSGSSVVRSQGARTPVLEAIELHPTEESKWLAVSTRRVKGPFEFERIERNAAGGFWRVFQHNKWRLRLAKEAAEAAAIAEAAADAANAVAAASVAAGTN